MLQRFEAHLLQNELISTSARVLVGYSGGADSTCLLHLLVTLGFDVTAAHLHHGQRDAADKELQLCEAFCGEIGAPFISGKADVPRMALDLGVGLEEAGRKARYEFFRQAAHQFGCDLIATAHTKDDHVETVIFNMSRGTGLSGLAGIHPLRDGLLRPLLPFTRAETRAYCQEHGLWFHDDPANADVNFSRTRIRLRVMPELRLVNPAADDNITRLSTIADEEDRFLDGMAAAALERSEQGLNGELGFLTTDCEIAFDRAMLTHLPPVLLKRAIRLVASALGSVLSFDQTIAVADGLLSEPKGSVTAEGGELAMEWSPERLHARQLRPVEPYRFPITLPGETISDEFGWVIEAFHKEGPNDVQQRASLDIAIDPQRVQGSLYLRSYKEGDEMQPLGFEGRRKLSDLLSEAKLTLAARRRLPIICDMLGPVWAPGVCLSQRVNPTQETRKAIVLRFRPTVSQVETAR